MPIGRLVIQVLRFTKPIGEAEMVTKAWQKRRPNLFGTAGREQGNMSVDMLSEQVAVDRGSFHHQPSNRIESLCRCVVVEKQMFSVFP